MNMIIDALPSSVRVAGVLHPVRTDFRIYMMLEQLIADEEISKEERVLHALELVYEDLEALDPADFDDAVAAMLWFYRCGKPEDKRLTKRAEARREKGIEPERVYDFDQDAEYIYAAFLEQYGVDLCDVDLHWWKFHAMLHALREDCLFVKIMGYRSADLNKIKDKKEKNRIAQLKALYKLRNGMSEEEKAAALYDPTGTD